MEIVDESSTAFTNFGNDYVANFEGKVVAKTVNISVNKLTNFIFPHVNKVGSTSLVDTVSYHYLPCSLINNYIKTVGIMVAKLVTSYVTETIITIIFRRIFIKVNVITNLLAVVKKNIKQTDYVAGKTAPEQLIILI